MLDLPKLTSKKAAPLRAPPPVPVTGWQPPREFPDLRGASVMAVDVETYDPDLDDFGPGWGRNRGHMVGYSIAAEFGHGRRFKCYVPFRHQFNGEQHLNCDSGPALAWCKAMIESPVPKVLTNAIYDVGWLKHEGINIGGELYDVQFAEALLDERGDTALDYLAHKYLGEGKPTNLLYQWLASYYGGKPNDRQRANIYRAPPSLVGHYGEADATLPLDIIRYQWPLLQEQGLIPLFRMENKLIRLLVKMRWQGVQINGGYAEQLYSEFGVSIAEAHRKFFSDFGMRANASSGDDLARVFDYHGVRYPKTAGGSPSFTKDWLKNLEHPLGVAVNWIRELEKLQSTFVRSYLLDSSINGRIHCSFHPLRGTDGGAKTGRYSSSKPNLQNIPVRSKEGQKIRKAFIPFSGHECWEKNDYSQIEYRMLAHFAVDDGDGSANLLRDNYINNPLADYHDTVYDNVCPYMGWNPLDEALRKDKRRPIKNTNFGLLYGQGQAKLARTMGFTDAQANEFFNAYHSGAPYVKPTMRECATEVHAFGYVTTLLGRRTRFDLWEPSTRKFDEETRLAFRYETALQYYGSAIKRAYDYRAVNYKFQGSAADVMKIAMVQCDEAGIFDVTGVPVLTVHDELDISVIDNSPYRNEAHRAMVYTLENAVKCRIPIRVDGFGVLAKDGKQKNRGSNWGEIG